MDAQILEQANALVNDITNNKVKVLRKERGLLEKKENDDEKIILAEDNRQILFG